MGRRSARTKSGRPSELAARAGGGRVVIPKGAFLTGAIHLESNVDLYLSEGATLLFSRDPKDYLPMVFTRFESTECMNYSPFIYAFEKRNIGITGPGTLDGQADEEHWWPWARKARGGTTRDRPSTGQNDVKTLVEEMGNKDVPVGSAYSAKAITCGRTSSSRTAARTCCWRVSPSSIRPCGS